MQNKDTIAAIASGMTASGIGIIRISGPEAFDVAEKIVRLKSGKSLKDLRANTFHYGTVTTTPGTAAVATVPGVVVSRETVDEVLVLLMRAPHSYTAEDTVEIDCHGGPLAMQKVLSCALMAGARAAEPGEFTKRAFLNGRIDLSEAEAVMDLIEAKNEYALKSSVSQLRGSVKKEVTALRAMILGHIARIEAALDDPEHMSLEGYGEVLKKELTGADERILKLLHTFDEGKLIREGIRTVILGKPNTGKSSLLNILTGEERAIVTEIAGTTRDTLTETVRLGGITLNIADTAGIRRTDDKVEKIGVEKAREYAENADLILYIADSSVPLDENDCEILDFITDHGAGGRGNSRRAIAVLNKSDLPSVVTPADLADKTDAPIVCISAREGTGITELTDKIKTMFFAGGLNFNEEICITNARQKQALSEAHESIGNCLESIASGMSEDFYSIDLTDAYASLGKILGEEVGDDVINEIFSKFCMGK